MTLISCFKKFDYLIDYQVYIDGNNVAYTNYTYDNKPLLSNIINFISYLIKEIGFHKENIHCICDPSLRYYIDKPSDYKMLVKEGVIHEAPKVADEMILNFALKHEFCFIISNDRFKEYIDQLPSKQWLEERRVPFMIIGHNISISPNVEYNKIDLLPIDDEVVTHQEKEITTLTILENIERSKGELDLY